MDKTKIIGFAAAALIAVASYFTGVAALDSINIAFNREAAKAACVKLLEEKANAVVPAN